MAQVHWVQLIIFVAGEIATLILPRWILPRVMEKTTRDIVRPETSCAYFGVVGMLQGVMYFVLLGLLGKVWNDTLNAIMAVAALVGGFGFFGFGLFYWASKEKIVIDEKGLNFHYVFRKSRLIEWKTIEQIKQNWIGYIVIKLVSGKSLLVPESYQNTLVLLLSAKQSGVQIFGYELDDVDLNQID
jgi:hypothetical protein